METDVNAIIFKMLTDRVSKNLEEKCGIEIQEKIVLGFSGGADSICLLDILHKLGFKVVVAYFNHQLRTSVDEEVLFVRKVAKKYKYDFRVGTDDIKNLAEKFNKGIEETARKFRYQFLVKVAQETKSAFVVVAHHADDQVETIMMNLIRGTGLNGLIGMEQMSYSEFSKSIPIVRPLLNVWKDEIMSYCEENDLVFATDETNIDEVFTRNRIRGKLIPVLEKYNPKFKQSLIRMSDILRDDNDFIRQYTEGITGDVIYLKKKNFVEINIQEFRRHPVSVQRYIINDSLQNFTNIGKKKTFNLIENIRKVFAGEITSHYSRLLNDFHVIVEKDRGYLLIDLDKMKGEGGLKLENEVTEVDIPGSTPINRNWFLKITELDIDEVRMVFNRNEDNFSAYLDAGLGIRKIHMRKWQAGDRYAPLGLSGHSMKLSDFWINKGFPKRFRADWPLILLNEEIIWIPGFQPAFDFRITDSTKCVIKLDVREEK